MLLYAHCWCAALLQSSEQCETFARVPTPLPNTQHSHDPRTLWYESAARMCIHPGHYTTWTCKACLTCNMVH